MCAGNYLSQISDVVLLWAVLYTVIALHTDDRGYGTSGAPSGLKTDLRTCTPLQTGILSITSIWRKTLSRAEIGD